MGKCHQNKRPQQKDTQTIVQTKEI